MPYILPYIEAVFVNIFVVNDSGWVFDEGLMVIFDDVSVNGQMGSGPGGKE